MTTSTQAHTGGNGASPDYALFDVPPAPGIRENGDKPQWRRPLELLHADQLEGLAPIRHLDAGRELPEASFVLIYGASGAGKSFWMLDRALRIAQSRPVVYVAAEGAQGFAARVLVWRQHFGMGAGQLYFVGRAVNMLEGAEVAELVALISPLKPALVVLDTLARCMVGGDENSAKDMGRFIAGCDFVRERTGATVAPVHHTGKAGTSERGSSSLKAACDQAIEIANSDGLIRVACRKSKDSAGFGRYGMRLVVKESGRLKEDGERESSCVILPAAQVVTTGTLSENQWAVLEAISMEIFAEAGAKARQLMEITGLGSSSAYTALNSLKRSGYVSQNQKGDPFYITLEGAKIAHANRILEGESA